MDAQDSNKLTRRKFIGTSAFAAGIIGSQFMTTASAQPGPPKPLIVYPWDVEVDPPSIATLYLVQSRRLNVILNKPFERTLAHMRDRARAATGTDQQQLEAAINHKPHPDPRYTKDTLATALENARANCRTGISYAKFAALDHGDQAWLDIQPFLVELEKMICVPILHTNPVYIEAFLTTDRVNDIDWHGNFQNGGYPGRELEDLFMLPTAAISHTKHTDPGRRAELPHWKEIRNSGLLWCSPRVKAAVQIKEMRIAKAVPNVPNNYKCINGRCSSGYPNEYCQEVNGSCSGMSEP